MTKLTKTLIIIYDNPNLLFINAYISKLPLKHSSKFIKSALLRMVETDLF